MCRSRGVDVISARGRRRLVVADDSHTAREHLRQHLEKAGYQQLSIHENGQAAYEEITALKQQAESQGYPLQELLQGIVNRYRNAAAGWSDTMPTCKK